MPGRRPASRLAAVSKQSSSSFVLPAPRTVRIAGALVGAQGAIGLVVVLVLVVRGLGGSDQSVSSSYGTAGWFAIIFGAVFAAGVALLTGRRWGRAIAVVAQLLLIPFAWALLTDSHQTLLGAPLAVAIAVAIVCLFAPATSQWMAQEYGGNSELDDADRGPGTSDGEQDGDPRG
nr:hypothetical protein [Rhodococcus rhodnii]